MRKSDEVRLAHIAFNLAMWDEEAREWLLKFAEDPHVEDRQITATGPSGIRCGFVAGMDPVAAAVMVGFYLLGPLWPQVCPGLLKEVNKIWKNHLRSVS